MASLPQISATLGLCIGSNKNNNAQPCIAKLHSKKSTQLSNLVAKHQIAKGAFFPLVGQNKKPIIDLWKAQAGEDSEFVLTPSDIEATIINFYNAINEKQIENLEQLLSDKCVYQDLLFYQSLQSKKEVIDFLWIVMDSWGPNIKIAVTDIKVGNLQDNNLMATVIWQLTWSGKKIPFTHGCRFFRFKEERGRLIICEINGLEELPIKPGELVLDLIKVIRTFFDTYPPMATVLLDNLASQEDSINDGSS